MNFWFEKKFILGIFHASCENFKTKIEQNTPWFAISLYMIDKGETADNGVCIKNSVGPKAEVLRP